MRAVTIAIAIAMTSLALASSACLRHGQSTEEDTGAGEPQAGAGWPEGYTSWRKINAETVVREDEAVARELYARPAAELGVGTVLVKEQFALVGGVKGALKQVAVMTRTGAAEDPNGGWEFKLFDPETKTSGADVAACVGCHSLRAEQGYLFTPAADLQ
jgi:hypothetical protein